MREHIFLLYLNAFRGPRSLDGIVVFVIADGYGVVNDIADGVDLGFQRNILLGGGVEKGFLLLIEISSLLK